MQRNSKAQFYDLPCSLLETDFWFLISKNLGRAKNPPVQSLFLLLIGITNFVIIFTFKPYRIIYDSYLAVVFSFIEMFFFFAVLVKQSNIAAFFHTLLIIAVQIKHLS